MGDGAAAHTRYRLPSFPSYESNLTRHSVDARWKALQNSLSGLFCASLGNMDALHTTSPTHAFLPTGDLPRLPTPHAYTLRHATLPAERVCTENLTPFLKLLPCPSRAGIAALLEPHKIFDADWHGLGVHVRWRADEGVELMLTAQAVLDPVRTSADRRRGEIIFCVVLRRKRLTKETAQIGRWSRRLGGRFRGRVMLLWQVMFGSCYRRTKRYIRCPQKHRCFRRPESRVMISRMVGTVVHDQRHVAHDCAKVPQISTSR